MSEDTRTAAVAVEHLTFTFPGREQPTLDHLSFSLAPGTWTLLAGATGSGKSTLLRSIARLLPATGQQSGEIRLGDRRLQDFGTGELAQTLGLVLQSADDQLCATSLAGEIAFGLENLRLPASEIERRIDETCERFRLGHLRDRNTWQLSSGEKQRLLLAALFAMRPKILLLDEPLGQLDPTAALELLDMLDALRREGVTILLAEHRLGEVLPHVDRVLTIRAGRLVGDAAVDEGPQIAAALEAAALPLPEIAQLARRLDLGWTRTADELVARIGPRQPATTPGGQPRHRGRDEALSAVDLMQQFSTRAEPLWQRVSFWLAKGEVAAIVGPNGSGKTTLLDVLAGELRPSFGRVRRPDARSRRGVGLVMQNPDLMLFASTVADELAFGPRQAGCAIDDVRRLTAEAAERFDLASLLDEPPQALSRGQRLRVAAAAMFAARPRVLLLDEPTTGQDHLQVERVLQTLAAAVRDGQLDAMLFSTHDLGVVVEHADRVLVLGEGHLLADCTPRELIADDPLLARAGLHRTPLLEVRHRLGLSGLTVATLVQELGP